MKRIVISSLVAGLFGIAATASAAELVTTVGQGKGGRTVMTFDIASDVELAGFNFEVQIPGLAESTAKTGSCVSELPAGFDAVCKIKDGSLMVYAVSSNPAIGIGPGVAGVGSVELSGVSLAKKGAFKIVSMDASDQAGNSVGLTSAAVGDEAIAK